MSKLFAVLVAALALAAPAAPASAHFGHHHRHHADRLARAADQLGVTRQQLVDALRALAPTRADFVAERKQYLADLAAALNVSTDRLKEAVRAAWHSGSRDFAQALADALGTDRASVVAAYRSAGEKARARRKAAREKFVTDLAARLGVTPDAVGEALRTLHGRRHHHRR